MNLSTTYMGFQLPHPVIPGASPMSDNLDTVRRLEDAGAPMIIMHSIFEEQLVQEQLYVNWAIEQAEESYGEAASYLPKPGEFRLGSDAYLKQVAKIKAAVAVPVIASLNGRTKGGWISYAKELQQAGADGIELNIYEMSLSESRTSADIEREALAVIGAVRAAVKLPLAVKLSPFYTSPINFSTQAAAAGAGSIVIFNRFYQGDIDIENLTVRRELKLSTSDELLLRLRWAAAMYGRIDGGLAITGGVQTSRDIIKCMMVGADAVQIVSALLESGPEHLAVLRQGLSDWMEQHEYSSVSQMKGSMSLPHTPEPELFERGNYMRILQSWTVSEATQDGFWS
ncbi:MAG: dihydroorotate dehydrogenase-like protein [Phycisphaerae bacterium]|nr:dihydroorotate dehydrogenase-like protein [Phycisphaerae bacterium]